ncbi:MAG TPA: metalloregulator ArsR/SmtB family transcription factor [Archaeoglobus profundus]|nr:metalloregulator ArsR/SmtB family transcription factor [Archaeoglobus profundus]
MDINDILEALGNESRRRILSLLAKKPCYVSEISYSLKMAPKVVIEHLEKLEKIGLIKSFEEGRRRYYYIDKNVRLEISISPHRFYTTVTTENNLDIEKLMNDLLNMIKSINFKVNSISEIHAVLEKIEKIQRTFSKLQSAINSKMNELFEIMLDEIEKISNNNMERIVLLGLIKGLSKTSQIADEFGLPYEEVEKALENLKKKGIVEKVVVEDDIIWKIK